MFDSISLKFTELTEALRIPAQGVTVFVGPNNSGKSLVLREIHDSRCWYSEFTQGADETARYRETSKK